MKILHILQNYEPSKGGTQFLFKNISEILVKSYGDEVVVITTDSYFDPGSKNFKMILSNKETINGILVLRFSFFRFHRTFFKILNKFHHKVLKKSNLLFSKIRLGPWSPAMKKALVESNYDVICGSSSRYSYMRYPIFRNKFSNPKPFVFMGAIHFDNENDISLPKYLIKRIEKSEKYIANTQFEKDCLVRLGISPAKINVIGCGVKVFDFGKTPKRKAKEFFGLKESNFVVGYVGRFAPNKDLKTLVKAFHSVSKSNWKLILAGGTNAHLDEIRNFVNTSYNELEGRIMYVVDFDESLKEKIYSALDIFVSPSYSESFGIVFLEAWASKLPVIGTNIGAIRSVITEGEDGKLFPVSDDIELSKLLLFYFNDLDGRVSHGNRGFMKVQEKYTWEIITQKYRATYVEAISIFNNPSVCAL